MSRRAPPCVYCGASEEAHTDVRNGVRGQIRGDTTHLPEDEQVWHVYTRPHQLSRVQKTVLRWFREATAPVMMLTGHRTTTRVPGDSHDLVLCQSTVQYYLRYHGYIEPVPGEPILWRLTDRGRAALK
jgi:hypothetical protein